jgi:hypothetical protein
LTSCLRRSHHSQKVASARIRSAGRAPAARHTRPPRSCSTLPPRSPAIPAATSPRPSATPSPFRQGPVACSPGACRGLAEPRQGLAVHAGSLVRGFAVSRGEVGSRCRCPAVRTEVSRFRGGIGPRTVALRLPKTQAPPLSVKETDLRVARLRTSTDQIPSNSVRFP